MVNYELDGKPSIRQST